MTDKTKAVDSVVSEIPRHFIDQFLTVFHDDPRRRKYLELLREGRIGVITRMLAAEHKNRLDDYTFHVGQISRSLQRGEGGLVQPVEEVHQMLRKVSAVAELWLEAEGMLCKALTAEAPKATKPNPDLKGT